jgi:hypothetical protein
VGLYYQEYKLKANFFLKILLSKSRMRRRRTDHLPKKGKMFWAHF